MSKPGMSVAPSAASAPASPPAAPEPGSALMSIPKSVSYICAKRSSRPVRSATCDLVAPFCGANTRAASVKRVSTSQATKKSTANSRAGVLIAFIAPRPPSVVADPPRHTMIFLASSFSAILMSSPVPLVVAFSGSLLSGPPASVSPDAAAISITATPRCKRHCASTG